MKNSLRKPKDKHKIEHSHGWCGTCDDQAKPQSKDINISERFSLVYTGCLQNELEKPPVLPT